MIEEIRNGMQMPMNIPTRTMGWPSDRVNASPKFSVTTAEKAEIIASAANAAAPIAKPFPIAAVVLPNSSNESVIFLTSTFYNK